VPVEFWRSVKPCLRRREVSQEQFRGKKGEEGTYVKAPLPDSVLHTAVTVPSISPGVLVPAAWRTTAV
jgi:hypothetical protein